MLERSDPEAGRWIPPGQPAAVGPHAIPGGLVYLGRYLPSPAGAEPALINPELSVAAPPEQGQARGTGPRAAYHLLSPQERGEYLHWLASGRRADVAPGLVLLFCLGLERRVLLDADTDPAVRAELPAITAEVRRLRVRYRDAGPALCRSLDDLLALLELLAARGGVPAATPGGAGLGPMGVRVALARFAAASVPVPVEWARVWVGHHPALRPRSVQQRCPAEFDRLFTLRYQDRHGAGLSPPADVPGIRLRYRPANPGLPTTLVCREDLPDVLTEPRCTRALGSLVDSAATALEPYRQWSARFPEGRGSLAAAALLPRELVDVGHGQVGALRVWAERQLDGRPWAVVDAGGFWAFWSTAAPDRMARDEAAALLAVLALLDLGVEPDVRFGAPSLTRRPAVLFRLGRPASDGPGAHFPAAAAIMRCAVAVASAISAPVPIDPLDARGAAVLATVHDLATALRLDPGEDLRLIARLGWLLTTRVDIDRLGRHTAPLTAAERQAAGHYLITVAQAVDPAVGPACVAALTRVYRILGLVPDLVFQRLHERSVGYGVGAAPVFPRSPASAGPGGHEQDEPVVVQVAGAAPSGYALPWADEQPVPGGIRLDRATISHKIAESDAAATLLSAIFDAGDDEPAGAGSLTGGAEPVATLDPAHSALLRALAARTSWSRDEFAELAAAHGVLPDGALDMLNDVAIEITGVPVVADSDTLAIDDDVLVELLA
ncbi:MAG TPA: TerB N-terminal domain-containing protein [Rugosimonospora sp.]|nr:TerB N-terminal domain-containing protein [Rugosimonospora sp.]